MKTTTTRPPFLRLLAALFIFCLIAPMAAGQDDSTTPTYWKSKVGKIENIEGGNGTDNPILIATAEELAYFAQQVNKGEPIKYGNGNDQIEPKENNQAGGFLGCYFALSADIDLKEDYWTPIGTSSPNSFNGNFDGKGHCVSGLKVLVTEGNYAYAGLFGNAFAGTIRNLGVCVAKEGVRITNTDGANYAGGIVGYLYSDASLSNCYATVDIKIEAEGGRNAGGIVGHSNYKSTISCTYATGDVEIGTEAMSYYAGGICGYLGSSTIEYSLALNGRITGGYKEGGNSFSNRIVGLKETNATLTTNYASAKTLVNDHRVSSNLDDPNGVDIWLGTFAEDLKKASPANNDWNTAWIWPEGKLPQLNNFKHEQPEIDASTVLADLQDLSLELNESSGKIFLAYQGGRWLYNGSGSESPTIPFNGVVKGGGCPITIQNTVLKTKATDAPVLTFDGGTWDSSEQNAILKVNADANMIMKVTNDVVFINTGGPAIDNAGTLTIEAESSNSLSAISPNGAIRNTGTLALQGNSIYLAGGASTIDNKGTDVVFYSPMVEWQFNSSQQGKLLNWESSRFSLQGDQFATCRSFATTSVFSTRTFSLTAGPSDGSSAPVTQQGRATDGTYTTAFSTQGGQQLAVFTDVKPCPRLHLVQPSGGSLTIVGTNGMSLSDGDYVTTGTELTLSCSTEANFYLQGYLSGTAANSLSALTGNTVTIGDNDIWLGASLRYENPTPPTPVYYSVYLPQVEGAVTDPGPGEYEVESWSTFRFYLTLDSAYSESQPVVTTSRGETLVPRTSDGAYLVKYVRTDVEVFIDGIVQNPPPVANEVISTDALAPQIWAEGSMLCIRMPEALPSALVRIFTPDGRLYDSFDSTPGLNRRQLPTGMYIVRVGDAVRKVVVSKT